MKGWMADNEFKDSKFVKYINFPEYLNFPMNSLADSVILREVKRNSRIYCRTIELSFCAKQSVVAESLLYQKISTIPLNCAPLSSIFSVIYKFSCEHSKIPKQIFPQLIQ